MVGTDFLMHNPGFLGYTPLYFLLWYTAGFGLLTCCLEFCIYIEERVWIIIFLSYSLVLENVAIGTVLVSHKKLGDVSSSSTLWKNLFRIAMRFPCP